MAAATLAVVPRRRPSSTSVTYIAPSSSKLTPLQRKRAVRILSPTLPTGWVNYSGLKPRIYGRSWGLPNYCSKCGKTAHQLADEQGITLESRHARRFMFVHALVAH